MFLAKERHYVLRKDQTVEQVARVRAAGARECLEERMAHGGAYNVFIIRYVCSRSMRNLYSR